MPAPLNVNREAVKTLAIAIGVRQAAREMGLPQGTVQAWSKRGHWFDDPRSKTAVINGRQSVQPLATKAPSVALQDTLARLGESTRANLAKAHSKATAYAAKLPAKELMSKDKATALRLHGQGAGLVHQWEAKQQQTNVMVNVALLGIDPGEVQATARVIEDQ